MYRDQQHEDTELRNIPNDVSPNGHEDSLCNRESLYDEIQEEDIGYETIDSSHMYVLYVIMN